MRNSHHFIFLSISLFLAIIMPGQAMAQLSGECLIVKEDSGFYAFMNTAAELRMNKQNLQS